MQTHGFGETVAPLGTALTIEHIQILLKYAKTLVFCFDGDTAGQKAAARAAEMIMPILTSEMSIRFAFMTNGKDPDEVLSSGGDMNKIIDASQLLADYVWDLANKNFLTQTEPGRARASKWLRDEYTKIPDLVLRNEMLVTLKSREWDGWNKYRHTIFPKMKTPDPITREQKMIAEIAQKFPELYDAHFETLGKVSISEPCDTGMTIETARKIIIDIKLNNEIKNLKREHAPAEEIQKLNDKRLELWN
jgi:DNA primase